MAKKEPLKVIEIILIVLGAIIIVSAFPLVPLVAFDTPLFKTDIPQISATRIAVGFVLALLGLTIYFGKEGLKAIKR
ncbi:hypothetical protein HYW19_01520 [Candidatus Woesearchaeota archaeon]|nr:hypothetical protein [Candidatus Woesearchaeota archaeon]